MMYIYIYNRNPRLHERGTSLVSFMGREFLWHINENRCQLSDDRRYLDSYSANHGSLVFRRQLDTLLLFGLTLATVYTVS